MLRRILIRACRPALLDVTIVATVLIFALSLFGMGFVQQQFFPSAPTAPS
jgi:multidrug efflux pump subunit AcrB